MPVVGTAGHVDHGKSTLVQQITGRNPDRWEEEKRRGLTIDLGFAWATLPGGSEISFIDVPGHEKFLKNMLAGIEAIDVALFVVAADEGWMPQSEEHLAVLDLLDVETGVVALTKCDLVDDDLLELALAETSERLAGSSLADAPVIPVSGVTGHGVGELLEQIEARLRVNRDIGRPRLWVDRSFPVSGAGTVVTGTLVDGEISVDDSVVVFPGERPARVRGIQSHEKSHQTIGPGRRVALNLGGIDHHEVGRGDFVASPGAWLATARFAGSLRPARFVDELTGRGAYQLHIGSTAVPATISGLSEDRVVFNLDRPVPLAIGDRYILRDTGRKMVVAGGRVLDPSPGSTKRALELARRIDPDASPDEQADALVGMRGIERIDVLAAQTAGGTPAQALSTPRVALSLERAERLAARARELVDSEHRDHPLRPGIGMATLAEQLGVEPDVVELILDFDERLVRVGPDVARPEHRIDLDDQQEKRWQEARQALAAGLGVPDEGELGLDPELTAAKIRQGDLVRVAPGLVYLPAQIDELKRLMAGLGDAFTVADFRDAAGLSRKYAVPILEWSDREGLTVRRGDTRRFR